MTNEQEIKLLKKLVKAQSKMLIGQRLGTSMMPGWVFDTIDKAKKHYQVNNVADIK